MPSAAHEEAAKLMKAVDAVLDRHGQNVIQVLPVSAEEPPYVPHSRGHEVQVPLLDVHEVAECLVALRLEMPDDKVSVHDVDDQDPSRADELPVLLEDPDIGLFVVIPERRPEVEGRVERPFGHRHRFRETPEVSDAVRRAIRHTLLAREFGRARDEHRRQVYAYGAVAVDRLSRRCDLWNGCTIPSGSCSRFRAVNLPISDAP